jgi:phosphatidylglycerol:prolipoprotein diacylglycerol transferase
MSFFPSRSIFLTLGVIDIHWYGIMYALGFLLGMWMLPRLLRIAKLVLTPKDRETLVLWIFFGVLLGGRLGFVLFYGGTYFLDHPLKILALWEGGMSSHGGFLGVCLALFLFTSRKHIDFFRLADVLVIPVSIGLALGRLGNLINGELYGTLTTLPWGMQFPSVEGVRHPTQIYAILKDLFTAIVCYLHLVRTSDTHVRSGRTGGWFLILYGIARFVVEIFREQPYGYAGILGLSVSRGQLLTIPILLAGIAVLLLRRAKK